MCIKKPNKINKIILISCIFLSGCASVVPKGQIPDPDPFEYTNRKLFKLNKFVDKNLMQPAAKGYRKVTTPGVRKGVNNFFANLQDVSVSINALLQGKIGQAGSDVLRFGINTTLGVGGIFDVADNFGLEKHYSNLGETFSVWGLDYSPYVVLPILGSSTIRDSVGMVIDGHVNPLFIYVDSSKKTTIPYYSLQAVAYREDYLDKDDIVNTAAFDEYVFFRNAYLQKVNKSFTEDEDFYDDYYE